MGRTAREHGAVRRGGRGNGIHTRGLIWSPGGEPSLPEEEEEYEPDVEHYYGPRYLWNANF
ncbi:hypothetical protein [Streptosporangium carneum]|uniref:Uncharacterized protein n=1 Tax=Streptosporangium carneum TaxID=47481 RepID=A0A9W6IBF5_9ACTN|nr:hypothetical protein [Streptosporangium carneum]GLK15307.1 hypothetical protein GCM10017600_87200 [Streptosporangium carneum]